MLRADDGLQRVGLTCTAKYLLPYLFNQALPQLFFCCTFFVWLLFEGAVYLKKYGTLLLHNICNAVLHDVGRTGNHNMLLLQMTELSGYYS